MVEASRSQSEYFRPTWTRAALHNTSLYICLLLHAPACRHFGPPVIIRGLVMLQVEEAHDSLIYGAAQTFLSVTIFNRNTLQKPGSGPVWFIKKKQKLCMIYT